jgi:putative transcriptional regulator
MSTKKQKRIVLNKDNFGELLLKSSEEALLHSQGKVSLNSETLELPKEPPQYSKSHIKEIRERILKVSQPVFASILACSDSAVKSWERGENTPSGTTRRLLQLIENDPEFFLKSIS